MKDQSGNPVLSDSLLDKLKLAEGSSTATIAGTALKIFVLLIFSLLGGYVGWQFIANGGSFGLTTFMASMAGLLFAIMTITKPNMAGITAPLYSIAQGFVLGAISQNYSTWYDGIVLQAIAITGAIFFVSLWAFSLGLIKVTDKFRTGVIIATAGIAVYYLISLVMSLFGVTMPLIYDSGPWGIAFSAFIVFAATLNLILDYDLIQQMVKKGAPKTMEWFGAFALIVTLLWLYIEVLNLLAKIARNN